MRRRLGVLTALFVVVFSGFFATAPAYAATGWTVTCTSPNRGYSCVASSGYVGQSTWGYPVNSPSGAHNCTNYAAYRLARNGASNPGNLGNATDWDNNAAAKGFRVDGSPVVGSIAQWEGNTGPAAGVPEGHVAYVEAVTDSYIDISQDAWGGTTSTARIQRGGSYWPSHFLHIKDLANDNPFGAYDSLTSPGPGLAKVSGWAIDPSSRTTSLSVHVYVDGIYQGAYDASVSRPDVASAYPGSGDRHGYAVTFNIAAGQHTVCVYAINIGAGTENPQIGCKAVSVVNGDPFGAFDEVTSPAPGTIRVRGWAVDPSDRPAPINVHIYVGGRAGSGAPGHDIGKATVSRPDVAAAIPGAGPNHGFDKILPAAGGTYIVCAYAINAGGGVTNTELLCRNVSVVPALTAPVPTIAGTAKVGHTLTGRAGSWGPAPVTLTYQWKRNGKAIAGATRATHVLSAADRGTKITLSVTGSKPGYGTTTKTSAATGSVAYGNLTAPTPKITGTAKVGKTLTTIPGSWGPRPVALRYQWKANGKSISGATKSTFTLTSKQKKTKITVTVVGSKTGYLTATKTSSPTSKVKYPARRDPPPR